MISRIEQDLRTNRTTWTPKIMELLDNRYDHRLTARDITEDLHTGHYQQGTPQLRRPKHIKDPPENIEDSGKQRPTSNRPSYRRLHQVQEKGCPNINGTSFGLSPFLTMSETFGGAFF
ncbi:hypothetical protein [Absidia glauca]|uniref:Uncharacterized protein n=1 Tax=Absidia glauca TaxID=4829 RepID=A0A168R993_ABSGL|nr:hypothetical protein [Absidia glauca]